MTFEQILQLAAFVVILFGAISVVSWNFHGKIDKTKQQIETQISAEGLLRADNIDPSDPSNPFNIRMETT